MVKRLILLLAGLGFACTVCAQRITLSPVLGYGLYRLHLSERLIGDKFLVGSAVGRVEESREETNHIGLMARFYLKQNRYYLQANLTYGDESSALGVINLQPREYFFPENSGLDYYQELIQFGGLDTYNRTVKSSITGGRVIATPLSWLNLRAFAGFSLDHRSKRDNFSRGYEFFWQPDEGFERIDQSTLGLGSIEALRRQVLMGHLGLGFDMGNFWLDLAYHRNLSRFSDDLRYYEQTYDFRVRTSQWLFTLGYQIVLKK